MKNSNILAVALSIILLSACQTEYQDFNSGLFAPVDNGRVERAFSDIQNIVEDEAGDQPELRAHGGCIDTVIVDTNSIPWLMTIDFGSANCLCSDGLERRGKIIATFSGPYRDAGSIYSITTQNYYVEDWKLVGMKTVTNEGLNTDGNFWYSIEADDVALIHPNGDYTLTWESSRTREWIEGEGTLSPWDDVYLIDGTAHGVDRTGNPYTVAVTDPLRVELICPWVVSGSLEIRPQDLPTRYVNYGNGNCDGQIDVTVEGETYQLNI